MIVTYQDLSYSKLQCIRIFMIGGLTGAVIGYMFYHSWIGSMALIPYGFLYYKNYKQLQIENRKWTLNMEFKDALLSISTALNAGYSIENAFIEAYKDIKLMYQQESYIVQEFKYIVQSLTMNEPLKKSLIDFSNRSGVEDITNFTNVLLSSIETGGEINKIVKSSTETINSRIEVKREIQTLISAKQLETNIMSLIPMGIILYLNLFSPGFLDPIYSGIFGRIFMTILLILYYFSYQLGRKIVNLKF